MKSDRLPPNSVEAEQGVLGCILQSPNDCMGECIENLKAGHEYFYDVRHRKIYSELTEMYNMNCGIDTVTLQQSLKDSGKLDDAGGVAYLASLPDCSPSSSNLPHYLEILKDKYLLRRLLCVSSMIGSKVYEFSGEIDDLLDEAERDILAIRPQHSKEEQPIKELVRQALFTMEDLYNRQGSLRGLSTGLPDLDRMTGGMVGGEMTVVAGYPGAGKTSFAMNLAERVLLESSKTVGVFSLEMSAVSLVSRFVCSHARVSMSNIKHGVLTEGDFDKLKNTGLKISASAIWFEDESDLSIDQLRSKARRLKQKHGIQFLVVDYIQLLTAIGATRKTENRQQEVADISRGIKATARELNIPVIALSQLNDEGKLRESRAIGQDADNVWILEPDTDATGDGIPTRLKIMKARNSPTGFVDLLFLKPYTRFESVAKVHDSDKPTKTYKYPHND